MEPLYAVLWPLYDYGFYAVYVFFVISGFVFYYLYYDRIHQRAVGCREFWWLRFSRLYPLHFVTLLFVAAMQLTAKAMLGSFIVYPFNNARHFLLNLLFASDWGLEWGYSFNAPAWSVSIEILLYAVFFVLALLRRASIVDALVMIGGGIALVEFGIIHDLGIGIACFFSGGLAFLLCERLGPTPWAILACGRPFKLIGDITYATYLPHFPIQLTVIFALTYFGIAVDFSAPVWLFLFLGAVIGLSIPTYYCFELPMLQLLRGLFRRKEALA